jgi:hypothetical protein
MKKLIILAALLLSTAAYARNTDRLRVGMTEQEVLQVMEAAGSKHLETKLLTCGERRPPAWTCKQMFFRSAFFSRDHDVDVWFEQVAIDVWRVHSWDDVADDNDWSTYKKSLLR